MSNNYLSSTSLVDYNAPSIQLLIKERDWQRLSDKEKIGVESYSIKQATVEQIFNKFAGEDDPLKMDELFQVFSKFRVYFLVIFLSAAWLDGNVNLYYEPG